MDAARRGTAPAEEVQDRWERALVKALPAAADCLIEALESGTKSQSRAAEKILDRVLGEPVARDASTPGADIDVGRVRERLGEIVARRQAELGES